MIQRRANRVPALPQDVIGEFPAQRLAMRKKFPCGVIFMVSMIFVVSFTAARHLSLVYV